MAGEVSASTPPGGNGNAVPPVLWDRLHSQRHTFRKDAATVPASPADALLCRSSAVQEVPFHSSPVSTGRLVLPWANEATARHLVADEHDGSGTSVLASLISASPAARPAGAVTVLAAAAPAGATLITKRTAS
jgi:hypothetical protein